jgi:hypothetical protein
MGQVLTDEIRAQIKASLTAKPKRSKNPKRSYYRYNGGRAHMSDALGVAPDQVQEYRDHLKAHGCTAEVHDDGRIEIGSEKQFREVAKIGGLYNGRDGYGAKDSEGNRIMTGREQGEGQQRLKQELAKEMRGYPSDYFGPQARREL